MKRLACLLVLAAPLAFGQGYSGGAVSSVQAGTGTGSLTLGGVLCKGAPAQATTGTTEEILATCTIPANTLSANGTTLVVSFFAHSAANGNTKTIRLRIGGIAGTQLCYQSGAHNNQNFATLTPTRITRTGASTATSVCAPWAASDSNSGSSAASAVYQFQRAASATWANANDLVITGQTPTAAGDLTLDSYVVEVVQ